ncbi:MAG: prolyl oligopeptidase family serine peptidase [Fimbriimonas sp.]
MRRCLPLVFFLFVSSAYPQTKTVSFEDAKKWETLSGAAIAPDGRWLAYRIAVVDGDARLIVRNVDSPQAKEVLAGSPATFSDDSKWAAYLISPPKAVADRLRDEKKPIRNKLGLLNLATGEERRIDDVQRFRFLKGGRFLLAHRYRPDTRKEGGSDLTVMDLSDLTPTTLGNVVDVEPNEAGNLLALRMQPETGESSMQILDPVTGNLRTLFWGVETVGDIQWAGKEDAVAYLVGTKDEKREGASYRVFLAKDFRSGKPTQYSFDPKAIPQIPKDARITEYSLEVNDPGTVVAVGLQPWKERPKPAGKPEDRAGVEIWNTRDVRTLPRQKVTLEGDRRRTTLAVWRAMEGTVQVVGDSGSQAAALLPGGDYALLRDTKPYEVAASNGVEYADYILVNTRNGERRPLLTKYAQFPSASRTGRYLAFFDRGDWWMYDVANDRKANLTARLGASFLAEDYDGTSPVPALAAGPEWLAEDAGIVLHDDYDAWLVRTAGLTTTKLTDGRKDKVRYRLHEISQPEALDGVPISGPFHFSTLDRETKASGYYVSDAAGKGKSLIMDKVAIGNFVRAEKADRAIFTMQSFEKSPDVYVTNLAFSQAKPVTKLNPFQKEYAWPKAELISFRSRFGKNLQGVLVYPADYVKGRRYPMVTYIYERLSQNLNQYVAPNAWSPYNSQVLAQNGYFVFMPDITYKPRNPGKSAVDCLEPALEAVFRKQVGVDPAKVGLIGHSWGGYQTAFVTTVSKMFAVGVAGAPLTELTSMYNSFYWNSGVSDQVLFEISQGRMEVPFWEDPKPYIENSPVWQASKRTAPLLLAAGDADGAVDYHQSLYMYQTLRRMGKPAVLLLYAGENHNFTRRPNQLDYGTRLRHFLDVHLKGVKPEPWVNEGIPLIDQKG